MLLLAGQVFPVLVRTIIGKGVCDGLCELKSNHKTHIDMGLVEFKRCLDLWMSCYDMCFLHLRNKIESWEIADDIKGVTKFPDLISSVYNFYGECFCVSAKNQKPRNGGSLAKEDLFVFQKTCERDGYEQAICGLKSTDYSAFGGKSSYACFRDDFIKMYNIKQAKLSSYRRNKKFDGEFVFCVNFLEQGLFLRDTNTMECRAYVLSKDKDLLDYIYRNNSGELTYILFLYYKCYKGMYGRCFDIDVIAIADIPNLIANLGDFEWYGDDNGLACFV